MTEKPKKVQLQQIEVKLKEDENHKGWFDLWIDGNLALYFYKAEGTVFLTIYREVVGVVHV